MTSLAASFTRPRKSYAKVPNAVGIPYLIELQKNSYLQFLQADVPANKRSVVGLESVFKSVFPIEDYQGAASVEFVSYSFEEPKYSVDECRQRGVSFSAPLKVVIRLVVWDVDKETNVKSIKDVKEQEVYFGEIPLMTDSGTFIINGTERELFPSSTVRPECFSTMTRVVTARLASYSIPPALFPIAAVGWTSNLTPKIHSTCASTVAGSSMQPYCLKHLV